MLPLKKIKFENTEFYAPNNPSEYIVYECPNYMEFPTDIGFSHHNFTKAKYLEVNCD